jgi:ABC-type dipeptide/oligopeptide/nickel transport system permease component
MDTLNPLLAADFRGFWDNLQHMILPMMALGTIPLSIIARMTRSSLLEVLGANYVRTARAKGVRERGVVFSHAFRNAMLPVVTIIGLSFGSLLSGAVLTETIFGLSGVGDALFSAITGRDYTVVQAFTIVIAVIFVFVNLVVDILYVFLDPRIRLE